MKVLVVDNDEISLKLTLEILSANPDYKIVTAPDRRTAFELVLRGDVPLVISDWMMPRMDGITLCHQVREAELEDYVYFVLVMSPADPPDLIEGYASGADEFISKPLNAPELHARIQSIERLKNLHDVNKATNRELRNAQAEKDDWTNMVVHDLRSPMAAILGYSDLLSSQVSPEVARKLAIVRKQALRVNDMLEQMLVTARSEAGQLSLSRTETDMRSVVEAIRESAAGVAADRRVDIAVPGGEQAPCVAEVDSLLVSRVLDNIVSNAVRFSPPDSEVRIELRQTATDVLLSIVDHGPGIPADERVNVFRRYRTLERQGRGRSQFGLGLAFCRIVVEAHGGSIRCRENVPRGARFEVRLPRLSKSPVGTSESGPPRLR